MPKFMRIGELATSVVLNHEQGVGHEEMTVSIVGVPRGGTTMVAAAVDAMGINLGPPEDLREYHFEDQTMHSPYLEVQYECVKQRNQERSVWGWKDPTGIDSLQRILFALRNPHIILVFRDILATIQGELRFDKVHEVDPPRTFEQLSTTFLQWWSKNLEFANRTQFPSMLVSYERVMLHPVNFVSELAGFLGVQIAETQVVLERISRDGGYLVVPLDSAHRRDKLLQDLAQ